MIRSALASALLAAGIVFPASASGASSDPNPSCAEEAVTADALNAAFDAGIDGMVGADYQRTFDLDDGRVLWVFQDAFIEDGNGAPTLVHNAAAVQDGMCFDVLTGGSEQKPDSWVAEGTTRNYRHWYWPLDGYQPDDDTFVLFVAEMEERGERYLGNATPVATWTVEIDLDTMEPGPLRRAPNPSEALYGFSITTDDAYRYLYAQCHRQFGFSFAGHDPCAAEVYIARQPLDDSSALLEYWDGQTWTRNSNSAANIAPIDGGGGTRPSANPMQIERDGDRWIAVTKSGDWFGEVIYFDVAPRPEGPWSTTAVIPVATQGNPDEYAAYFVSFVPSDEDGRTIAMSNNRWDGVLSDAYRPVSATVPAALWGDREASQITKNLWLPLGDRLA